jgi:hypothetical protein
MSLIKEAVSLTESGDFKDIEKFLSRCLEEISTESLAAVQLLAWDDYGGITFNTEFKRAAAFCLAAWGELGIDALARMPHQGTKVKDRTIPIALLAHLAAGDFADKLTMWATKGVHFKTIPPPFIGWHSRRLSSICFCKQLVV